MTPLTDQGHRLAARLGVAGATLGVLAGVTQATVGPRIPDWTGAKASPVDLGLLTVTLALAAGLAAVAQNRPGRSTGARAVCALGMLVPALLCLTTVGRLWYIPGGLLLTAGIVSIDSWPQTASALARNWLRCLLSIVGAAELLMSAGAAPLPMAVGAIGSIALIAAAWLPVSRLALGTLVIIGTLPFATLAWTAVIPVLLLLVAVAVAAPLVHAAPLPP